MDREIAREEWAEELDSLSAGNLGRKLDVEVDDPDVGAQEETELELRGLTYDHHDRRIEIMLGPTGGGGPHHTHSIQSVEKLEVHTGPADRVEVIRISHGPGHTLLKFH